MPELTTYEEYKKMGESACFVSVVPNAEKAVKSTASRLGRQGLYLPLSFSYDEIKAQNLRLAQALSSSSQGNLSDDITGKSMHISSSRNESMDEKGLFFGYNTTDKIQESPDKIRESSGGNTEYNRMIAALDEYERQSIAGCEQAYKDLKGILGDAPIAIDHTAHHRPLGMARFLLTHGFNVTRIFVNAVSPEESGEQAWLNENAPDIKFEMPVEPSMRVKERIYTDESGKPLKVLAIGGQAAWFTGTNYFVNMVEGGDLQGIDGIRRFADLMEDAWLHEKDASDLVPRKGLGCESCI